MNKKVIRTYIRLLGTALFFWLYIPHLLLYLCLIGNKKRMINTDLMVMEYQIGLKLPIYIQLLYHLHNNRYYRNVFYHRLGPVKATMVEWYRPGDRYFNISVTTRIGESMWIAHPYATVLNADSIGSNFKCIHCTTLGIKANGRPVIGNNVSLGANVTIVGNVHVGNNVIIGAGSVVVKDIPDNCIAVGNPCKPIKYINDIV